MYEKSYSELMQLKTFDERFNYLKLDGRVGECTFGYARHLNQMLYKSEKWLEARDNAIVRDEGCDLGIEPIKIRILVHHINPLTPEDIEEMSYKIFDLNNLITTTYDTHRAIHFGKYDFLKDRSIIVRHPNDTSPWLK